MSTNIFFLHNSFSNISHLHKPHLPIYSFYTNHIHQYIPFTQTTFTNIFLLYKPHLPIYSFDTNHMTFTNTFHLHLWAYIMYTYHCIYRHIPLHYESHLQTYPTSLWITFTNTSNFNMDHIYKHIPLQYGSHLQTYPIDMDHIYKYIPLQYRSHL